MEVSIVLSSRQIGVKMPLSSQEGIQCTQWILIELRFLLLAKTIAALERVTYFIKLGISVSDTNFPQGHAEIVTLYNEMTDKIQSDRRRRNNKGKKSCSIWKKVLSVIKNLLCYRLYEHSTARRMGTNVGKSGTTGRRDAERLREEMQRNEGKYFMAILHSSA